MEIQQIQESSRCSDCEYAIYCFCDESQWVFRTKKEMKEIMEALEACPIRKGLKLTASNQ